jgi:glycosidase
MIMMYFLQGSTSIFYGEEIGLPGNLDPDCRRPMV